MQGNATKTWGFYGVIWAPRIEFKSPEINSMTVSGTKITDNKGIDWYAYGSTLSISTNGQGSYTTVPVNLITGATGGATTANPITLTESSILTCTGSSGTISVTKDIAVNIMPNASGITSTQSSYYSNAALGKIFPVYLTGTASRYYLWNIYIYP